MRVVSCWWLLLVVASKNLVVVVVDAFVVVAPISIQSQVNEHVHKNSIIINGGDRRRHSNSNNNNNNVMIRSSKTTLQAKTTGSNNIPELKRIPTEMEGVAIPFVDLVGNSFIECYADSVTYIDNVEYTIGVPCDYSVAICYFDDNEQLIPVELDDNELMDDVFPIAESIVAEEFGEELVLQRTPQTLTLVGELEEDDEEDDDDDLDDDDDDDENDDDEEEVEVLLSFEHRGKEYNLVRLLDPILLVGKTDPNSPDNRLLLTPEESDVVMPILEEAFLAFHDDNEKTISIGEVNDDDDDDDDDDDLLP